MVRTWLISAFVLLTVCCVSSQQQVGLANLLQTILANNGTAQQQPGLATNLSTLFGNNGTTQELSQNSQQQPGIVSLLTILLSDNEAALALLQTPALASNFAELLTFLNTTGNVTGVANALSTDAQVSSLTTALVTLLFESLSLTVLTNNRVSETCQTDMIIYIEELLSGTQWALKMIDATGKPGSDIADGLTKFIGSYEECVAIRAVSYSPDVDGNARIRGSFDGQYCSAFFDIPGIPSELERFGAGYMQLGVCVPDTCAPADVQIIVSIVERIIFNRTVLYPPTVRCQDIEEPVGADVIVSIGILSIIGCLIFVGTLYDILVIQNAKSEESMNTDVGIELQKTMTGMKLTIAENGKAGDVTEASQYNDIESKDPRNSEVMKITRDDNTIKDKVQQKGTLARIFLSFSIYTNTVNALSVNQAGSLTAINGIRVLTMGWLVLVHTYYYAGQHDANLIQFQVRGMNNWTNMILAYSDVAVDTFFALSGILVAYISLKKLKKVGGPRHFNWIVFYVHRVLRITPTYMLILMIGTVLLPRLFHGPLWNPEALTDMQGCTDTWWANLLYVHNYLYAGTKEMCMGWSWYLSADMHMYMVSPLLIVPFFINAIFGLVLCIAVLIAIMVATGVVTYNRNYTVQPLLLQYINDVNLQGFYEYIYNPSHMRFGAYIVGILTGYLLYRWDCKVKMSKMINLLGWFVSISISLVILYVRYSYEDDRIFSRLDSAIFMALHRVLWSAVPCWIIFSCTTGYGGWINKMLTWKAFVPLGRLTFVVYLIHPIVMVVFYASRMVTTYFTEYELIYLFLAHTTLSFGVAFLLFVAFELPVIGMEKVLLGRFVK